MYGEICQDAFVPTDGVVEGASIPCRVRTVGIPKYAIDKGCQVSWSVPQRALLSSALRSNE